MTQQQVLHGIKTDGAQPEGVLHGVVDFLVDFLVGEIFQKSQHLHEFPLAPPSHPGLQQTAQRSELFGELPSLQRSGLVQGRRLLLQQGQVVDGIEDEVVPFVGAGMSGNDTIERCASRVNDLPTRSLYPIQGIENLEGAIGEQRGLALEI